MCSCQPCVVLTHLNLSLQLTPIISDPEYLLDQHILISIKSSDSDESYGKCLAIKFWMSQNLLRFFQTIERVGENRSNSYRLNIYDLELNIHRNTLWAIFCEVILMRGIWTQSNNLCELYQLWKSSGLKWNSFTGTKSGFSMFKCIYSEHTNPVSFALT